MNTNKLYTYKDLAEYLQCSEVKLRMAVMNKQIPYVKIGKLVRFTPEQVEKIIRMGTREPQSNAQSN